MRAGSVTQMPKLGRSRQLEAPGAPISSRATTCGVSPDRGLGSPGAKKVPELNVTNVDKTGGERNRASRALLAGPPARSSHPPHPWPATHRLFTRSAATAVPIHPASGAVGDSTPERTRGAAASPAIRPSFASTPLSPPAGSPRVALGPAPRAELSNGARPRAGSSQAPSWITQNANSRNSARPAVYITFTSVANLSFWSPTKMSRPAHSSPCCSFICLALSASSAIAS